MALCVWAFATGRVDGQVNASMMFGAVQYDMANDDPYFTYGVQVRYYATPVLRVGFMGGTAHIGDPPLRDWTQDGTDERMWRGAGFVEVGTKPFHKVSGSLRGFLGLFYSSGVIVAPPPVDYGEFYGITDTNTGLSYGGGAGLEVGPFYRLRFLAQANMWLDQAYGGSLSDPELIFGLGIDF